jgi:hypothetical protein
VREVGRVVDAAHASPTTSAVSGRLGLPLLRLDSPFSQVVGKIGLLGFLDGFIEGGPHPTQVVSCLLAMLLALQATGGVLRVAEQEHAQAQLRLSISLTDARESPHVGTLPAATSSGASPSLDEVRDRIRHDHPELNAEHE